MLIHIHKSSHGDWNIGINAIDFELLYDQRRMHRAPYECTEMCIPFNAKEDKKKEHQQQQATTIHTL